MKRIADSTIRRLSLYLRFLEEFEARGLSTISSDELAARGGTTSAQVRKDLSFFGSFGKRGLGYSVPELSSRLRKILGLEREWRVIIIGAGKIGAALAQYNGFAERGFHGHIRQRPAEDRPRSGRPHHPGARMPADGS